MYEARFSNDLGMPNQQVCGVLHPARHEKSKRCHALSRRGSARPDSGVDTLSRWGLMVRSISAAQSPNQNNGSLTRRSFRVNVAIVNYESCTACIANHKKIAQSTKTLAVACGTRARSLDDGLEGLVLILEIPSTSRHGSDVAGKALLSLGCGRVGHGKSAGARRYGVIADSSSLGALLSWNIARGVRTRVGTATSTALPGEP